MALAFSNIMGYMMLLYYEATDRVEPTVKTVLSVTSVMCAWLAIRLNMLSKFLKNKTE